MALPELPVDPEGLLPVFPPDGLETDPFPDGLLLFSPPDVLVPELFPPLELELINHGHVVSFQLTISFQPVPWLEPYSSSQQVTVPWSTSITTVKGSKIMSELKFRKYSIETLSSRSTLILFAKFSLSFSVKLYVTMKVS